VEEVLLRPDTLRLVSDNPDLAEKYRQATVNYQVANLLDVRALSADTQEQAAAWRRRAADRREQGDRLLQHALDHLPAERPAESPGPVSSQR